METTSITRRAVIYFTIRLTAFSSFFFFQVHTPGLRRSCCDSQQVITYCKQLNRPGVKLIWIKRRIEAGSGTGNQNVVFSVPLSYHNKTVGRSTSTVFPRRRQSSVLQVRVFFSSSLWTFIVRRERCRCCPLGRSGRRKLRSNFGICS